MNFEQGLNSIIDQRIRNQYHYGVVTAITNTSGTYYLSVKLAGSDTATTNVRYVRSYVPRINDTVLCLVSKNDVVVIDALAENERTLAPVAERTTSQTIPTSTDTKISFDTVLYDTWNCWDLSPNPTRLTVPVAGIYFVTGRIVFDASSSGHRSVSVLKNNITELVKSDFLPVSNSLPSHGTISSPPVEMAVGDYIELEVWHSRGSNLDVIASGDHRPSLGLIYLGP